LADIINFAGELAGPRPGLWQFGRATAGVQSGGRVYRETKQRISLPWLFRHDLLSAAKRMIYSHQILVAMPGRTRAWAPVFETGARGNTTK
jgi:hypothetical protein